MNEIARKCRLCGSIGPHKVIAVREMQFGTQEIFQYYECAVCDTLQIVDLLDDEELKRHYPTDYYSYNVRPQPRIRKWLARQQDLYELHTGGWPVGAAITAVPHSIRTIVGTHDASGDVVAMLGRLGLGCEARILDVGCGRGALLDRLAQAGFSNLVGADPLLDADGETTQGVRLVKQYLSEVVGEFDLIMFNHSLEHVPDLIATLKEAHEKLAAEGSCLVRLPTTSSEAFEIYGPDWMNLDAPRHTVIPSRQGFALAAGVAGLRVDRTFDDSSFIQFVGSEAYRNDIALTDPKFLSKVLRKFGWKKIWDWQRRAERLNRQRRGDCTGFVLRVK